MLCDRKYCGASLAETKAGWWPGFFQKFIDPFVHFLAVLSYCVRMLHMESMDHDGESCEV